MDLRWARSKLIALDMDPLLAARLLVLPRALPRLGLVVLLLLLVSLLLSFIIVPFIICVFISSLYWAIGNPSRPFGTLAWGRI